MRTRKLGKKWRRVVHHLAGDQYMAQKDKNNSPFTLLMLIESQSRRLTPAYYRHLQQEYNHSRYRN